MILIDFTTDGIKPTIFNVSTESTNVTVYWQLSEGIAEVTKYEILISSDGCQWILNFSIGISSSMHTVSDLSPETVYVFQVRAGTSDKNGTWSEPRVGITLPISKFV